MRSHLRSVVWDCQDPGRAATFWARLLDRPVVEDALGNLVLGSDTQLSLRFMQASAARTGPDRMHVHITSTDPADQAARVAAALDLGARHCDVGQRPEEGHVVLADVEGMAFCVIEPDNAFLAGCGPLAELACDGGRDVGVFWSAALKWPLVWDQDDETAIQAPSGGTKVAWGGASHGSTEGAHRQYFDVVARGTHLAAEVDRLLALGATTVRRAGDHAVLVDPAGVPFRLASA